MAGQALEALAEHVRRGRLRKLGVERFDGAPVVGSPFEQTLIDVGFRLGATADAERLAAVR